LPANEPHEAMDLEPVAVAEFEARTLNRQPMP
jgi:hypothetical protein